MADDIGVGIGVKVTGDPSGAEAVDEALKQVGATAEDVSRKTGEAAKQSAEAATDAAEKATAAADKAAASSNDLRDAISDAPAGGLADAVGDLDVKASSLSDEKKKAAVNGFAQALTGLAKGDVSGGMRGVAESLFQLSSAIPLPGAAVAFSLAITGVAAAWKAFGPEAEDAGRSLNEFGETLDEEMSRLESWMNAQIDWENIKEANRALREDFTLVKATADSTQKSIEDLFATQMGSKISGLRDQAAAAAAGGDQARAADLAAQAESLKQFEELVKLNVTLTAAKADLSALQAQANEASANYKAIAQSTADSASYLEAVKSQIVERSGSTDATVPGSEAFTSLLQAMEARLERISSLSESTVAYLERTGNPDASGFRALKDDEAVVKQLVSDMKNLQAITDTASEKEKTLEEARKSSNEQATQAASSMVEVGMTIEALEMKLRDMATAAGPDQAAKAAEQAGKITGVMGDMLDSVGQLTVDNADGIKAAADAAISGAKSAIGLLGEEVAGSAEAASEVIGEGNMMIKEAVEGTAAEAGAAGEAVKQGAEEFRSRVQESASLLASGAGDLASAARTVGRMAADTAASQLALAQEVASLRQQTSNALYMANLALSQNRNSRA